MTSFIKAQRAARTFLRGLDKKDILSIVRIGSSLRREDFVDGSDIDFLIIQKKRPRDFMEHGMQGEFEINVVRRGKREFLSLLKKGIPLDLIAVSYGRLVYGPGFFASVGNGPWKPKKATVRQWMRTGLFQLTDAVMAHQHPIDCRSYFRLVHHSSREFCRAIIAKEKGVIVEGDWRILSILKEKHTILYRNFRLIVEGRKKCASFSPRQKNSPFIAKSGRGKYLLAAEEIAHEALRICSGVNFPKANDIVKIIMQRHPVREFYAFTLHPESNEMLLFLKLEGSKLCGFCYNAKNKKNKEIGKKIARASTIFFGILFKISFYALGSIVQFK